MQLRDQNGLIRSWVQVRKAERFYLGALRKIAKHIGELVMGGINSLGLDENGDVTRALQQYSRVITPWAQNTGQRMVMDVERLNRESWVKHSQDIGVGIKEALTTEAIQPAMVKMYDEQVRLIKSLPIEAATRVHNLTMEAIATGERAESIAKKIAATGEVTASRAMLIARTEVGRTATALTEARARAIGSDGYTWMTAGDSDVRHSHALMQGKYVRWDEPPTLDGLVGHAGALPNCRCIPIPVLSRMAKWPVHMIPARPAELVS